MNETQFVKRPFQKRAVVFYTDNDATVLRNNVTPPSTDWLFVGRDNEKNIKIVDYLSYDEMTVSALFGVSSPTLFINDGSRGNCGVLGTVDSRQRYGIIGGFVGARFEKRWRMEHLYCVIPETEDQPGSGKNADLSEFVTVFSRMWAKFLGIRGKDGLFYCRTYKEMEEIRLQKKIEKGKKFADDFGNEYIHHIIHRAPPRSDEKYYFCISAYKLRMKITVENILFDANFRGKEHNKQVFLRFCGLGMGFWAFIGLEQEMVLMDLVFEILSETNLPFISDVEFVWYNDLLIDRKTHQKTCGNDVKFHYNRNSLADILTGENSEKLLYTTYPWDSNAFPGNEYWQGHTNASSDPAAACCSFIPELHNPEINKDYVNNQWLCKQKTCD
jgi:hypothetical protein